MWSRHEQAAATTQTVAAARASERRNGVCRVNSPRSPTGTDEGKGRGRGTSCTSRRRSGSIPLPRRQAPCTFRWPWMTLRTLFLRALCTRQSLSVTDSFEYRTIALHWEMTSKLNFVFGAYAWFASGYMHCVSLRCF